MDANNETDEGFDFTTYMPIPDETLLTWVHRLHIKEVDAGEADDLSRAILRDFCTRTRMGLPQSRHTLQWLTTAFDGILEHQNPMAALRLAKRAAQRPKNDDAAWNIACWLRQAELRGYSPGEAVGLAANLFSRDTKSVERDRRTKARDMKGLNPDFEDWEDYFLQMKRPLPPRRIK